MKNPVIPEQEEFPVAYRGYKIYQRQGAPIWEKNPVSGHEYVVDRKPGHGFSIERVDPSAPPVLSPHTRTLKAAKEHIDFMLKFPFRFTGTETGRFSCAEPNLTPPPRP